MFSFLKKTKTKKIDSILHENNKENQSSTITSSIPHEKNHSNEKIHIDITGNPSDQSLLTYDHSNKSSPRDLSSLSSPPHHHDHQTSPTYLSSTGTVTSSQIVTNDLNRMLTSGYLNADENMGYMKRGGSDHVPSSTKSPQFHRPIGFSYNRTQTFTIPGTKKGMKALVTGQTKIRKIHCSTPQSPSSTPDHQPEVEKEAIVLSRYSGGFIPDPDAPRKIESLDWPAPIAMQAVPELMKPHRSRSESRSNPYEPVDHHDQLIPLMNVDSIEHDELRHDEKLDKDINEMSKIKDSSGMAHALLEDLRFQEKVIAKQLPLDPWKASRSPSAAIEPPRRCRFDSPKFASPSRRSHTHSSSMTNADDSFTIFSPSIATTPAGRKPITLPRAMALRHDDSLTPISKAQTLPNQRDKQRSCDLDSTLNSCYSNEADQNKSTKTVDGGYTQSTHSAPALMSNPKIYPYEELKVTSKIRLPSDVDRDHLERHLSDQEFHHLFQLTRSEFYRLPEWRRTDLKKRLKLF